MLHLRRLFRSLVYVYVLGEFEYCKLQLMVPRCLGSVVYFQEPEAGTGSLCTCLPLSKRELVRLEARQGQNSESAPNQEEDWVVTVGSCEITSRVMIGSRGCVIAINVGA